MTALATPTTYTFEEYLELERKADYKSELVNGYIYAMAGASRMHNLVTGNAFGELRQQLKGRKCEAYTNAMRVLVEDTGLVSYPDVVAVCGSPRMHDSQKDALLNPVVGFRRFKNMCLLRRIAYGWNITGGRASSGC